MTTSMSPMSATGCWSWPHLRATPTPLAFTNTKLAGPTGVAVDSSFNVYVANWGNGLVLKLPRR